MADVRGAFKQLALAETYVDPGTGNILVNDSFPICPSFGAVYYRTVDFGFPDVRSSVQNSPQSDGTLDQTQYTGARNITLEGVVLSDAFGDYPTRFDWDSTVQWNSSSWFISLLSAWANPARRYRFYFTDEIGRSRYMDVRGDSFTAPIAGTSADYREFQLNMVNPSGKVFSFMSGANTTPDGRYRVPILLNSTGPVGRAYPELGPYIRNYPAASIGYSSVHYGGTVPNGCLIQLYSGSSTLNAPRVTFTAPDKTQSSIGLQTMSTPIPAHTTLTFDTINHTVTAQADNSSVQTNYESFIAAPIQWPQLRPGINNAASEVAERARGYNKIDFTGTAASDATLTVIYNEADLL